MKLEKIVLPEAVKYPFEMGDEEFHPTDFKFHYEEILMKLLGEQRGCEARIVDVEFKGNFVVLTIEE